MTETLEMLEDLEEDIASRAFLYANPSSYREGVEAALAAVRATLAKVQERGAPAA